MDPEKILIDGSIGQILEAYSSRQLSVSEVVEFFLARIEANNSQGATLNAVKAISSDVMDRASAADDDLAAGRERGALHGIPVLLKDNFLTANGLTASAGSAALKDFKPEREATVVALLRKAGAIVLGKTNLTDFADYVSDVMPSGFSSAGGVVRNPHDAEYGRGQGSSVGSAASVAAGFAPLAMGSETQNSLQTPACVSSVFAYKPSVGLVSRAGIVPLVPSQDSPGPLTRCAEDAERVVTALAGADPRDSITLGINAAAPSAASQSLQDLRIGIPRRTVADRADLAEVMPLFEDALTKLSRAGARILDPCDLPSAEQLQDVKSSVFPTEFKAALNCFLEDHGSPCGISSMASLIEWNEANPDAIPYGQSLLLAAQETNGLADPGYVKDRLRDIALSRTAGIDAAAKMGVDLLMVPMTVMARCTGKAGAPVFAIPIGQDAAGFPVGVTLTAPVGHDRLLLVAGAAIADVIAERCLPAFDQGGADR